MVSSDAEVLYCHSPCLPHKTPSLNSAIISLTTSAGPETPVEEVTDQDLRDLLLQREAIWIMAVEALRQWEQLESLLAQLDQIGASSCPPLHPDVHRAGASRS